MNIYLKVPFQIMNKSNNLSKTHFSKNKRNLKLITEFNEKRKHKTNKNNLTHSNLFKYDFNNNIINNNTSPNKRNRSKKTERNFSSYFSRTTNCFDSDFFSPNVYSPNKNKIKTENLYTRIFSSKTNFTDNRIKSSTTKFTKSRKISAITDNNLKLLIPDINYSDLDFNNSIKENYFQLLKKRKKESHSYFIEKVKLVRKQKFINNFLENKYKYEKEMIEEKDNILQIAGNSRNKNFFLLKTYNFAYDKYLDKLYIKRMNERTTNQILKEKKQELEEEIEKINLKINKVKAKLFNFIFIKEFLFFVKTNSVEKIKQSKETNILLLKQNLDERVNLIYEQTLSKNNKNKNTKNMIQDFKRNNSLNRAIVKRNTKKFHSNINYFKNRNKSFLRKNTEVKKNITKPKKIERKSLITENKININIFETFSEFDNNFKKLEKIIFNDLESLTERKREIMDLKKILANIEVTEDYNQQILSKTEILNFLKNQYKILSKQLNSLNKKFSEKQAINKNLYKKVYNILVNINKKENIDEKIDLKSVFNNLNIDTEDFIKRMKVSKTLYIIKTLERIYIFYYESKIRYSQDIQFKSTYRNVLYQFKKEKEKLSKQMVKNKLENEKIEKANNMIKKYSKIYITSHMKYNTKLCIKNKRNRKKIQIKVKNEDNPEQFFTYY